jgi:hypothetical protein
MKMQDVQINSSFDLASIIELKTHNNILKNQEIKKAGSTYESYEAWQSLTDPLIPLQKRKEA